MTLTLPKALLIIGCILFVIAALCAGAVITGWSAWAFGFGAFAAWALSAALVAP
jgi:hypothetical protein